MLLNWYVELDQVCRPVSRLRGKAVTILYMRRLYMQRSLYVYIKSHAMYVYDNDVRGGRDTHGELR